MKAFKTKNRDEATNKSTDRGLQYCSRSWYASAHDSNFSFFIKSLRLKIIQCLSLESFLDYRADILLWAMKYEYLLRLFYWASSSEVKKTVIFRYERGESSYLRSFHLVVGSKRESYQKPILSSWVKLSIADQFLRVRLINRLITVNWRWWRIKMSAFYFDIKVSFLLTKVNDFLYSRKSFSPSTSWLYCFPWAATFPKTILAAERNSDLNVLRHFFRHRHTLEESSASTRDGNFILCPLEWSNSRYTVKSSGWTYFVIIKWCEFEI